MLQRLYWVPVGLPRRAKHGRLQEVYSLVGNLKYVCKYQCSNWKGTPDGRIVQMQSDGASGEASSKSRNPS